jgi:hypothetical protein
MNPILADKNFKFIALHAIIASTICVCPTAAIANTSSKTLQGLVEEQPKFDVSLSQNTFQLGIEHKEFTRGPRKPILHGGDKLGLLRGGTRVFRLKADDQNVNLQSQKAKTASNNMLHGGVDKNGNPLSARVVDNPLTPLKTNEHFHPQFQFDLRKLTNNVAPDIAYQMDQELEHPNNPPPDEVTRQEKLMESKLRPEAPHSDMPPTNPITTLTASLARAFESEMEKTKQSEQQAKGPGIESMKLAMGAGPMAPGQFPGAPGNGTGNFPKLPAGGMPDQSRESAEQKQSEREFDSELAGIKKDKPLSSKDLDAKIADAKVRVQTTVTNVEPKLDAVLLNVRPLDLTIDPAMPKKIGVEADVVDVVPWDEWHSRFAKLAQDPILANVSRAKKTSGFDTVEITVWRDHRVEAKLIKASNADFDLAILNAYKSLAGNPGLAFPNHSLRKSITFLVDNEHKGSGAPNSVQSQTSRGDREEHKFHI